MDGKYTWTIREILMDPRYREFAACAAEHGKQIVPGAYPWNLMGLTDAEILDSPLRFQSGVTMTYHDKLDVIGVVRAQEQLVLDWWEWWPVWPPVREPGPARQAPRATAVGQPSPGMLF